MSTNEMPATPIKLSFGATFGGAFSAVFGQFWMFIKAAILPLVLGVILGAIGFAVAIAAPPFAVVVQIIAMVPMAILGIACCRLVLLGRQAGAIPRPLFGRRTWTYVGYAILMMVMVALPMIVIVGLIFGSTFLTLGADVQQDPSVASMRIFSTIPLVFLVYFVALYFMTRFSLVFPAVSVDQKLGLGGSWRLTRGSSGFKLYAALIALSVVSAIGVGVITSVVSAVFSLFYFVPGAIPENPEDLNITAMALSFAPTMIVALVLDYLALAVIIAAVAGAYAQLSGWGGPREEILERFE